MRGPVPGQEAQGLTYTCPQTSCPGGDLLSVTPTSGRRKLRLRDPPMPQATQPALEPSHCQDRPVRGGLRSGAEGEGGCLPRAGPQTRGDVRRLPAEAPLPAGLQSRGLVIACLVLRFAGPFHPVPGGGWGPAASCFAQKGTEKAESPP